MRSLRFGIVGAGWIASQFTESCTAVEGVEVSAIASRDVEKAKQFAQKYKIPKAYGSYEELFNDKDIDAIYIATPHHLHKEQAIAAMRAGKHVLCEKPMTLTSKNAKEMFKCAEDCDRFFMEAMWARFVPSVLKAREWVNTGRIGKLRLIDIPLCFQTNMQNTGGRHLNKALAGGALYDMGVYVIELMQLFATSEIKEYYGICNMTDTGVDGLDVLTFKFADESAAVLRSGISVRTEPHAYLYGDDGYIHMYLSPSRAGPKSAQLYNNKGELIDEFKFDFTYGFQFQIAHFRDCVEKGMRDSDIMPHADNIQCCEIFEELLRRWNIDYSEII